MLNRVIGIGAMRSPLAGERGNDLVKNCRPLVALSALRSSLSGLPLDQAVKRRRTSRSARDVAARQPCLRGVDREPASSTRARRRIAWQAHPAAWREEAARDVDSRPEVYETDVLAPDVRPRDVDSRHDAISDDRARRRPTDVGALEVGARPGLRVDKQYPASAAGQRARHCPRRGSSLPRRPRAAARRTSSRLRGSVDIVGALRRRRATCDASRTLGGARQEANLATGADR